MIDELKGLLEKSGRRQRRPAEATRDGGASEEEVSEAEISESSPLPPRMLDGDLAMVASDGEDAGAASDGGMDIAPMEMASDEDVPHPRVPTPPSSPCPSSPVDATLMASAGPAAASSEEKMEADEDGDCAGSPASSKASTKVLGEHLKDHADSQETLPEPELILKRQVEATGEIVVTSQPWPAWLSRPPADVDPTKPPLFHGINENFIDDENLSPSSVSEETAMAIDAPRRLLGTHAREMEAVQLGLLQGLLGHLGAMFESLCRRLPLTSRPSWRQSMIWRPGMRKG